MARRTWTAEQRARALELYVEHGPREAARQTGIALATIATWARAANLHTRSPETTRASVAASMAALDERKAKLASDLMGDIQRIRGQLFAPTVERKVVTLSGGKDSPATWEVVDVERDQPTFADQKAIMTTLAIAVDKVQILTGAATERVDHTGLAGEREQVEERLATILQIAGKRAS